MRHSHELLGLVCVGPASHFLRVNKPSNQLLHEGMWHVNFGRLEKAEKIRSWAEDNLATRLLFSDCLERATHLSSPMLAAFDKRYGLLTDPFCALEGNKDAVRRQPETPRIVAKDASILDCMYKPEVSVRVRVHEDYKIVSG
jgi:hypothetical protein